MKITKVFSILGPGIIWAATSIGVSHIVQSTRAGADFGFALLGFILLAHVIKYPFFLFGPRYAALTGKSLLDGYHAIGHWAFYLFLILTFITMFFVQAGVTIVSSALAFTLFGDGLSVVGWAALIIILVVVILVIGHYKLLNASLKWMMLILVVLSVIAWAAATVRLGFSPSITDDIQIDLTSAGSIAFIVALMGWMPTAVEVSVWHSLWTLSRFKTFGKEKVRIAVTDFNVGYFTSLLLALVFVWLGAILMYGQGIGFANSAAAFASQLVDLYTTALGDWSWSLMAVVTFVALFSTTFAVADGFPQVWKRAYLIVAPKKERHGQKIYNLSLLLLMAGSWWIISDFAGDIKSLLDFVTTISFVSAPIYAWLNYRVMQSEAVDESMRPKGWLRIYALTSLTLLTLFSLYYLYWRFA